MRIERATLRQAWAHMLLKGWAPLPSEYQIVVSGVMGARVWVALDPEEAPIALGGVLPGADRTMPGMGWLSVLPGRGRDFLPIALAMRRVIRMHPGLGCSIRDSNLVGVRLGRLLGFEPTQETFGEIRNWRRADGGGCRHDHGLHGAQASVDG